jgi:3-phenylpropionate/trans-cinnamate dioxygenase ferredoxin component
MADFRTVARREDVPDGSLLGVELDEVHIVLASQDGEVFALLDRCSHEDFPLSEGELENGQITCLLHGARFDVATGTPRALPAVRPVRVFESRIVDGEIQVKLD